MTKDVIELAREAGFGMQMALLDDPFAQSHAQRLYQQLAKFAALVAARERERMLDDIQRPATVPTVAVLQAAPAGDAERRLAFLCTTDRLRMIEHIEGLWRVYQDEAPPEAEHQHWQAMTSIYYATPESAIDAAIASKKEQP